MAVIKTIENKPVLFKSDSDWSKLCFAIRAAMTVFSFNRITDKKTGWGTRIDFDSVELSEKDSDWFGSEASLYSGMRKQAYLGEKKRSVVVKISGRYWYFQNRANWGKLCYLIYFDQDITYLVSDKVMTQLADPLEMDDDGELVSTNLDGWKPLHFDAEYRRVKKIDGMRSKLLADTDEKEMELHKHLTEAVPSVDLASELGIDETETETETETAN